MKNKFIKFSLSIVIIIIINIIPYSHSHPGEGECLDEHGITEIDVPIDKDAIINLDGNPTEDFWTKKDNEDGRLIVPLATEAHDVMYLNITFVMNEDYLYILCQWIDHTTLPDLGGVFYDGIYFCWNIDVPDFSANFDGMDTSDMGGGTVDSWSWSIEQSFEQTEDLSFDEGSWNTEFEANNVETASTVQDGSSYTLEIRRKLATSDKDVDVQIIDKELYLFNMAVMNDTRHQDHYVSWTYGLDLREDDDANDDANDDDDNDLDIIYIFIVVNLILFISLAISLCIIILKKKSKLKVSSRD